jgi:radical SAM superfamily enzyme YgiQ (UPF0313 family)
MTYTISLVQPNDVIGDNVILPYAIGLLWEYANTDQEVRQKWQLDHVIYSKDPVDDVARDLSKSHMVVFSTYIWNSVYNFELAQKIKLHNPKCFIVMGGPHLTVNETNFWADRQGSIDLALLGEGDESFLQILKQYPDLNLDSIPGSWTNSYHSDSAPRFQKLELLPSPYLNGFYDKIIPEIKSLGLNVQVALQTNRGCPYHCSFCEEGKDYKNKLFFYNLDQKIKEIEWCGINAVEFVTIADDNWGIVQQDLELMKHFCLTKQKYGYPQILDATYAKNAQDRVIEMAKIDKEFNTDLIRGVTIALQTANPTTLSKIKRFNLTPRKQYEYIKQLKKLDIPIYAELIWPLPHETYDSFLHGLESTIESGLDNWIGVYPLSMQPSADLYDDYKDYYQWSTLPSHDNNQMSSHSWMNNPMSSHWADFDATVKGHVVYHWFVVLYFFGFARNLLDHLKKQGIPITQSVDNFIEHLNNSHGKMREIHDQLNQYWTNWLQNIPKNDFNSFPEHDTNFWYPYTHVASFLQENFDEFVQEMDNFLSDYNLDPALKKLNYHGMVRYGVRYPYQHDDQLVDIDHHQPEFSNLFEFCRYYYWWRRKRGSSRTTITKI